MGSVRAGWKNASETFGGGGWVLLCHRDAVSEIASDRGKGSERASIAVSRSDRWLLHPYIHQINPLGGLPPNPCTAGVCNWLCNDV